MLILLVLGVVLIFASTVFYTDHLELVENAPFFAGVVCVIVAGVVKLFFRKRKAKEKGIIEGVARNVSKETIFKEFGTDKMVLNFRVEITDKEGNIVKYVPVEIRGTEIRGEIANGDSVRVKGKIKHGIVLTKEVLNKTTNSIVRKK